MNDSDVAMIFQAHCCNAISFAQTTGHFAVRRRFVPLCTTSHTHRVRVRRIRLPLTACAQPKHISNFKKSEKKLHLAGRDSLATLQSRHAHRQYRPPQVDPVDSSFCALNLLAHLLVGLKQKQSQLRGNVKGRDAVRISNVFQNYRAHAAFQVHRLQPANPSTNQSPSIANAPKR